MAVTTKTLYDTDFAEWAKETAALMRAGRLNEVDLEHELYNDAMLLASKETGILVLPLPKECPFTLDELLSK